MLQAFPEDLTPDENHENCTLEKRLTKVDNLPSTHVLSLPEKSVEPHGVENHRKVATLPSLPQPSILADHICARKAEVAFPCLQEEGSRFYTWLFPGRPAMHALDLEAVGETVAGCDPIAVFRCSGVPGEVSTHSKFVQIFYERTYTSRL